MFRWLRKITKLKRTPRNKANRDVKVPKDFVKIINFSATQKPVGGVQLYLKTYTYKYFFRSCICEIYNFFVYIYIYIKLVV